MHSITDKRLKLPTTGSLYSMSCSIVGINLQSDVIIIYKMGKSGDPPAVRC